MPETQKKKDLSRILDFVGAWKLFKVAVLLVLVHLLHLWGLGRWKQAGEGVARVLELPADNPRPKDRSAHLKPVCFFQLDQLV